MHDIELGDLARARWTDDGSGLAEIVVAAVCEGRTPTVHRVRAHGAESDAHLELLAAGELVGRCSLVLAAVDGAGHAASQSLDVFAYGDGTVIDGATLDQDVEAPVVAGLDGARRLDGAAWSAVRVRDSGAGLARVSVEACDTRSVCSMVRSTAWTSLT